MAILKATLDSTGEIIEYDNEKIGEGGMKKVYFTPDKKSVVCFFKDKGTAKDPERLKRLQHIVGKYNPIANASSPQEAEYWKELYCWPSDVVVKPEIGVVAPAYPSDYFFKKDFLKGKEKEGDWFVLKNARKQVNPSELGNWLGNLQVCLKIARAVARLHNAGLAHSDLSSKNVLIDPASGKAIVIDIDSLVVKDITPPDVLGTPGYIAPEVLRTQNLPLADPKRILPSIRTDRHALAVLIYNYLLLRHPLRGPKSYCEDPNEDERLAMGEKALFIEHPTDNSNRPKGIKISYKCLGPYLAPLVEESFIKSLHDPDNRPTAIKWEKALVLTTDILIPCRNKGCERKWFVYTGVHPPKCPFCGWIFHGSFPLLSLCHEAKPGQFVPDKEHVIAFDTKWLFEWHTTTGKFPGPTSDRTPKGYLAQRGGKWYLKNQCDEAMIVDSDRRIPKGNSEELKNGQKIRLGSGPKGRLAIVKIFTT